MKSTEEVVDILSARLKGLSNGMGVVRYAAEIGINDTALWRVMYKPSYIPGLKNYLILLNYCDTQPERLIDPSSYSEK